MNKNLKTVLLIVLVIGVLLVAAFATGKKVKKVDLYIMVSLVIWTL